MKRYIKSSSERPYLYIFKHGIGPGTLPRDVEVIKTKDLPNYYTAVWLDRFLTTDELRQYDIPSETRINELLDRIGYCQKDGDVVPCDEVEACGAIKASIYVSQVWLPEDKKWEDIQEYSKWDNSWCEGCGTGPYYDIEDARADGYKARIIVRDESGRYVDDIEACMGSTSITSSTSISINKLAEGIQSYFKETGAETATNAKILEYLTSKGYDVSDVTNSEINEAWDLQASWWDGEEEDDGPVVLSDGMKIKDSDQAYIWLQENIEQYGNTYFWDSSLKNDLNRLIERFGNTYFWRS